MSVQGDMRGNTSAVFLKGCLLKSPAFSMSPALSCGAHTVTEQHNSIFVRVFLLLFCSDYTMHMLFLFILYERVGFFSGAALSGHRDEQSRDETHESLTLNLDWRETAVEAGPLHSRLPCLWRSFPLIYFFLTSHVLIICSLGPTGQ